MDSSLPPLLRQYDRLSAVAVLAILLGSLLYLIFAGLQQKKEVEEYNSGLEGKQPTKAQLTAVSLTEDEKLFERIANPPPTSLLTVRAVTESNLCTPDRRLLCIACGKPIPMGAKSCTFCSKPQPVEQKIDRATLDSDGDGMTDGWEEKFGLNPKDPTDADLDADNDGFTNIEEFIAKTDPTDPTSHPGYETRMSVGEIKGTKLKLRAINKMELPSTTDAEGKRIRHFKVTFVAVSEDGSLGKLPMPTDEGEEIVGVTKTGKKIPTGYKFIRYNEKDTKQIKVGKHAQTRFVNVSEVLLERLPDKKRNLAAKQVTTVFYDPTNVDPDWPGDPLVEQEATIHIDLPGAKEVTVAPGSTFKVKSETFTVKSVNPETKTVKVEKNADKQTFDLK